MTPQSLKAAILQLAIQGKLVPQRPEDGVARVPAALNTEKRKARRHGEEMEPPFDIPESWRWVLLPQVADILYGFPFDSQQFNDIGEGMPLIRIRDVLPAKTKTFTTESCPPRYLIHDGDMLVGMDGNFNVGFWQGGDALLNQRVCKISASSDILTQTFLYHYLPFALEKIEKSASFVTVKHLSAKHLTATLVPLPPLPEQHRIVAKIEELLPLIDRYEQAWTQLEDFNRRFPADMQKSLLQMAIQGQLVEQRPEEGTAQVPAAPNTEKKKARRHGEELDAPFEIPASWKWVKLESVTDMLAGFAFKSGDFKPSGKYRLLRGINLGVDEIRWKDTVYVDSITERTKAYRLQSGDVLIGLDRPWISGGTRVGIFDDDKETYLVQRVLRLRETKWMTSAFIALLLHSSLLENAVGDKTTGISVPHISPGQVGNLAVPLPPLAEQKRIVAELEKLLPLCERLK